ncbi:hypothetical protein CONCODRAFT_5270 [Conidiobolus coronatus NRRL 28638]|uniref:Uncharacterized protein n=1 Tax=Conidiobolus coronatus (strain ATCC 28846 / CBS 209.66 / NRRL 28638) TaxID=796925 RepID=A0A137PAB8_CONC2|nr:hypothetical protein CONCODRAFT_5270 [Conidiobolus coronatus NRRL 28638]|eukprot:KXN71946.1 hypothetical protein CONCODRAFT_5270 [Conidiobolus coronatus NRRL 28638]
MRFSIISLLIVSEAVLGFVTKNKHEDNNLNSKSEPNEQSTSLKRRTFNINLGSLLDIFTGGSKQNPPPNTGGQNIGGPQNYYPPNYYNNPYQWPYRQPYQPPYYPPYWPRPDPNPRPSPTKPIPYGSGVSLTIAQCKII